MPDLLKGIEFSMAKNGSDLYLKALEKLQLYASTTYKNGADVWKSLKMGKVVTFTPPSLDENAKCGKFVLITPLSVRSYLKQI